MEHISTKNFGINRLIGSAALSLICYLMLLGGIKNIAKLNSTIIPILIFFILLIGTKNALNINIKNIGLNTSINTSFSWIIQALIYASYNLILIIPVLINLKSFVKNKKQIVFVSTFTGIIISLISILIFLLLINVDKDFSNLEMPMVYVIKTKFSKFSLIYGIIILIAIFTTAVSVGISFLNNITTNKKSYLFALKIMCLTSIIISSIGFSNLVKMLFPAFGYLGLLQILFILGSNLTKK